MSTQARTSSNKVTINTLRKLYNTDEKITAVTAYDFTMARMLDSAGVDIILVGDSLGMVVQGEKTTLPVTIEHMLYHTSCVTKGVERAHVMVDMPFMSYQSSFDLAVENAGKLVKAGAQSVKLEGGEEITELIWYLNKIGIPVMAHIGLKPQSIHSMGGYKIQGKSKTDADTIIEEAKLMEEADAFALLLEGIPLEVAQEITNSVSIPTIGISSGPHCSGQILVSYDLLGANPDFKPKFVKQYTNLNETVTQAVASYCQDVKSGQFPAEHNSFHQNLVMVKTGSQ
ncbi:MAG: 3-methyl-2-oxobutanoate hydroxymethyltransferase [bacterium]|nr:3-methyl-2-oxobutanoate hydroxymethyltransferase [bacterium]MBU1917658.1 3-methyl-2-oxobutanoate hydroxymethyltransferase [bacterium]